MTPSSRQRAALTLVHRATSVETSWFCGRCATPTPHGMPPAPDARVCPACGLGLLLETGTALMPQPSDAFVVVDARLSVQALSRDAERLLGASEARAVNRPVRELLVPAATEGPHHPELSRALAAAATRSDEPAHVYVRPRNTFGVRLRARIGACRPPRAALVVLASEPPPLRQLR